MEGTWVGQGEVEHLSWTKASAGLMRSPEAGMGGEDPAFLPLFQLVVGGSLP